MRTYKEKLVVNTIVFLLIKKAISKLQRQNDFLIQFWVPYFKSDKSHIKYSPSSLISIFL
ncbi:hypothetical protein FB2170_08074 [Maribacter sp. HTCC2170]|nr:hypothetical protein FB2170_08074 [Maribacter sp. HTCC2170]